MVRTGRLLVLNQGKLSTMSMSVDVGIEPVSSPHTWRSSPEKRTSGELWRCTKLDTGPGTGEGYCMTWDFFLSDGHISGKY